MQIAICDDDSSSVQQIKALVEKCLTVNRYNAKIFTFTSGEDFLSSNILSYNIVILDVLLGTHNGMNIAHLLREVNKNAVLIFVSAYVEYAPKGFEVNAFRYLLKQDLPFSFNNCMKNAYCKALKFLQTFCVKTTQGEFKAFNLSDILYFESFDHNVIVHLTDSTCKVYMRLGDIEAQLHSDYFLRIHKSYIVNIANVKSIKGNNVCLITNENIMCSRTKRKAVLMRFLETQGE